MGHFTAEGVGGHQECLDSGWVEAQRGGILYIYRNLFSPKADGGCMTRRPMGWVSMVALVLFLTPLLALAQIQIQLPPGWPPFSDEPRPPHPESYGDEPRGLLEVINDWQDQVTITVWSSQRERIGQWVLSPGAMNTFEDGGRRIKVRPHYKIKVGEDWGWVDVGHVGRSEERRVGKECR